MFVKYIKRKYYSFYMTASTNKVQDVILKMYQSGLFCLLAPNGPGSSLQSFSVPIKPSFLPKSISWMIPYIFLTLFPRAPKFWLFPLRKGSCELFLHMMNYFLLWGDLAKITGANVRLSRSFLSSFWICYHCVRASLPWIGV